MLRAQGEMGSDMTKIIDEYRGPLFGYASMNFYAEFLAAVEVYNSYERYFGQLALDTPTTKAAPVVVTAATIKVPAKKAQPAAASASDKYRVLQGRHSCRHRRAVWYQRSGLDGYQQPAEHGYTGRPDPSRKVTTKTQRAKIGDGCLIR